MRIKIKATTATELCQIEKSIPATATTPSRIIPKVQKVIMNNSKGIEKELLTPIYSGNGFRGMLRRLSLKILLEKAIEKKFKFTNAVDFHLNNAGGGNNYQRQPFDIEDMVRDCNILVSVFGTSLAIGGKIKTPTLMPYRHVEGGVKEYYYSERKDGSLYSPRMFDETFYKRDDVVDRKGNAKYLSKEATEEWLEHVRENQEATAKGRESGEKVSKDTIKANLARDYVVRGTDFYTALSEMSTYKMTEPEKGMVYKALELLVLENLGSNEARDFGLMEYEISFQDGSSLTTSVDEYLEPTITKKDYKKEVKASIAAFDDWLENTFDEASFNLVNILVKKK